VSKACKMMEANGATPSILPPAHRKPRSGRRPYWFMPQGLNADITEAIKKGGVKIPVWVTGKIDDPVVAEEILRDGKADFVCIGRGLIADPYWPAKVKEGRVEDICPCIYDNRCNEDANLAFYPDRLARLIRFWAGKRSLRLNYRV